MKKILLLVFILSFVVRMLTLDTNLFFASEQGRDLIVVSDIVNNHKLTLIGPRTSIEGIFHGVLYHYLMIPPFLISMGSPMAIMIFFLLWQSLGAVFLYQFLNDAIGKRCALLGSLMYSTSFGLIVYSRWFSHPPLIIPFSILLFRSLYKISIKPDWVNISIAVVSWWSIFHFDLVVALFFLPGILIYFFWQKIKLAKISFVLITVISLLFFAPYLLFEIRHGFLMLNSFRTFLTTSHNDVFDAVGILRHLLYRYTSEISDISGPDFAIIPVLFLSIPALMLIFKRNKTPFEKLIIIWVLSLPTFGLFVSPAFGLKHYLIGMGPGFIILTAVFLDRLWQKKLKLLSALMFLTIMFNNFYLLSWVYTNRAVFYILPHPGMTLANEKKVIDEIYRDTQKNNFGWEAFTLPYFSPAGWEYLFSWYGKSKYRWVPKGLKSGEKFYVIIEPVGDKLFLQNWLKETMDKRGKLISETSIDTIRIQKRDTIK